MISISFTLNGRKVHPEDFGRELERSLSRQIDERFDRLESRIRSAAGRLCPWHQQPPKITVDRERVLVDGCCRPFVEQVTREIRS